MKSLPLRARYYLVAVWLTALALLLSSLPNLTITAGWVWIAIWLLTFIFADYFEVAFEAGDTRIGMTLAESLIIFLVAVGGNLSIVLVVIATSVVELWRKRPWYQALFNISQRTIILYAMLTIYTLLHEPNVTPFSSPREISIFIAIALTHHIANTLLVGFIVAFATKAPVSTIYRNSYRPVEWIHLLTLPIGAMMAAHWETNRWLLVFDILVLLIAQRSFVMVAQLQAESHRRKTLADERERLLEELKAQQEEIIRTSKLAALGTFASGIAHEFNNLLTVVLGQAQIGLVTNEPDEMRESLDRTIKACRRGRSITQGLLTFARQGETQRVMTQLREIVDDTLSMIDHDFEKEHVNVVRQLEPVPPTYCDPGQIVQVLLNLLTNARDALTEQGGGTITLAMRQEGAQIVLQIGDSGGGMPPEVQQQLFQPFVTTKGARGTGLGLAICYGIIESHNGSIQVASTLGQGTTMTIRLPIVEHYEPGVRLPDAHILGQREPVRLYEPAK